MQINTYYKMQVLDKMDSDSRSSVQLSGLNPQKQYFPPTPCSQILSDGVLEFSVEHRV